MPIAMSGAGPILAMPTIVAVRLGCEVVEVGHMHTSALIYIIRHGETNENRQGIIQGQMDTQLNDAGRAQAATAGKALEDVNFIAASQQNPSKFQSTPERSGAKERMETPPAIRGHSEHTIRSHERSGE
ncbi:hypothetical protein BDV93DRAFT_506979 [Ceratobasidium sp. AG-I]|nr:hypothetical protein BDV93DRAFT_506979 [Ceratobasidium sp. AG-I]